MGKLNELGKKYGTDKSNLLHGYLDQYEHFFKSPDGVKKVVEIGLQRGGKWRTETTVPSVRMWFDFFPNATIYGFDKQEIKPFGNRFKFYKGDQSRFYDILRFAELTGNEIDFLIDDGSHRPTHQLMAFVYFWPLIKKGGVYIIEDCNAVVQNDYPEEHRIHNLISGYLDNIKHEWIHSKSAGNNSSLVLFKN